MKRRRSGLFQVAVCGFHQTYLSRIENGQANPMLKAMEVMANRLVLTVSELWEKVRVA